MAREIHFVSSIFALAVFNSYYSNDSIIFSSSDLLNKQK